jgi:hypothetical protein
LDSYKEDKVKKYAEKEGLVHAYLIFDKLKGGKCLMMQMYINLLRFIHVHKSP